MGSASVGPDGIATTGTGVVLNTPVSATPISTAPWTATPTSSPAVAADPDLTVESSTDIGVDIMEDLILHEIGAVELSKLLRYDTLGGEEVVYSPVSTTNRVVNYSANNLLGQETSALVSNGLSIMNSIHYVDGETSRGYSLERILPEQDMQIQVAIFGDIVAFKSTTAPAVEVI